VDKDKDKDNCLSSSLPLLARDLRRARKRPIVYRAAVPTSPKAGWSNHWMRLLKLPCDEDNRNDENDIDVSLNVASLLGPPT